MSEGYWFAPCTEENSFLGQRPLGSRMTVEVRIARVVYRNEDNGFSVYDVEDTEHHWFKINGFFPTGMNLDTFYTVTGIVKKKKQGLGLEVSEYKSVLPHSKNEIIMVLRTLPRLDTMAPIVYEALGDDTLNIILTNPDLVAQKIKGVGHKMATEWQAALRTLKQNDVILQVLQDYKIPVAAAKKMLTKYPDIIDRLKISPYFLIEEVRGFSFPKCDYIALSNGYPLNGIERLQQAMLYVLNQGSIIKGDCYMNASEFYKSVRRTVNVTIDFRTAVSLLKKSGPLYIPVGNKELPIDREELNEALLTWKKRHTTTPFAYTCYAVENEDLSMAISGLKSGSQLVLDEDRVYLGKYYQAEVAAARCLVAMKSSEYCHFDDVEKTIEEVCEEEGVQLEEKQWEAVSRCCQARGGVFVLTGRAGCGKTFTLNIIMKVLKKLYKKAGLSFSAEIMAPTGKAAQVAESSTHLPAQTIHRALHLVAEQETQAAASIYSDCVVIDEFSMVGISLASLLLKAIKSGVKTIIMGDFEQLPSIEPGNVLQDIIESKIIPVITLNVVKRQAEGSGILFNANRILEGDMISSRIAPDKSLKNSAYIFKADEDLPCRDKIVDMFVTLLKNGYTLDDIQVLCPQKKTDIGVDSLNYFIQSKINPLDGRAELVSKTITIHSNKGEEEVPLCFREGDKVINTVNDYKMPFYQFKKGEGFVEDFGRVGIMNGETGRVSRIQTVKTKEGTHRRLYVRYGPNQYAMYEDDWSALSLAYAITIHRSQGSQWPVVIAPILFSNKVMLNRKLFYTLYTRAAETSILYGNVSAIQYTIDNVKDTIRNTFLAERLKAKDNT